jgi:hypothetical protein
VPFKIVDVEKIFNFKNFLFSFEAGMFEKGGAGFEPVFFARPTGVLQ